MNVSEVVCDKKNFLTFVGRYVRAGVDKLGTLGKSGASSPHAHCNLRFGVGYQKPSIQFRFDAIK